MKLDQTQLAFTHIVTALLEVVDVFKQIFNVPNHISNENNSNISQLGS